MKTLKLLTLNLLSLLVIATTNAQVLPIYAGHWGQMSPNFYGLPVLRYTNGPVSSQINPPWPGDFGDAKRGFFVDDYTGTYLRPSTDGSGWEYGNMGYNTPGSYYSGGTELDSVQLKMKWTPTNGWTIVQAPPGVFIDTEATPWWSGYVNPEDKKFLVTDSDGNTIFDSDNFIEGQIPTEETLAAWEAVENHYYGTTLPAYINYATNYNPNYSYENDPLWAKSVLEILANQNGTAGIIDAASKLNVGLIFQDGQWTVSP